MKVLIIQRKTGNCPCRNCGKIQPGRKMHPWTVWHKDETESKGHNEPVCSHECAKELADKLAK